MKTKHNELAIGITVTVATLLVVMTILLLGKSSVITVGMRLDMMVQDANGLGAGDNVTFRGITVGSVESVQLKKNGVLAVLKITGNPQIPVDSKFVIKEASLLGGRSVEIMPGLASQMLKEDAQVTGHSQSGILSFAESNSGVKEKVSKILTNLNTLSGAETLKSLYATLQSIDALTESLRGLVEENKHAVASTLTNLQEVSNDAGTTVGNLNEIAVENRQPIRQTIASMNQTTVDLQTTIKQTDIAVRQLNAMLSGLQEGKGSLGKLMVDDSLYRQMESTLAQVDILVKDIQQNPKKYVTFKLF